MPWSAFAQTSDAVVSGAEAAPSACHAAAQCTASTTRGAGVGVGVYPLDDSPAWPFQHMRDHERSPLLGYTHLTEAQIGDDRVAAGRD
jgi:hypothetical protein